MFKLTVGGNNIREGLEKQYRREGSLSMKTIYYLIALREIKDTGFVEYPDWEIIVDLLNRHWIELEDV